MTHDQLQRHRRFPARSGCRAGRDYWTSRQARRARVGDLVTALRELRNAMDEPCHSRAARAAWRVSLHRIETALVARAHTPGSPASGPNGARK